MTESGWQRSGVTPVGGGEKKVMVGARGMGGDEGGEVLGISVGEAEGVFGMSVGEGEEVFGMSVGEAEEVFGMSVGKGEEVLEMSVGETEEVFEMFVGESHEMEDGGSSEHICISLINSQSTPSLMNENLMNTS